MNYFNANSMHYFCQYSLHYLHYFELLSNRNFAINIVYRLHNREMRNTTKGLVSISYFHAQFPFVQLPCKVSKGAKIRNRYNQVPHLTQDTNGKVTNSQLDTTNESQEVSPFRAGDHKAHINRRAQRHSKHKTIKDPQKKYRPGMVSKIF